jgi:hypothetical protein
VQGVQGGGVPVSTVRLVDLATGVCTPGRHDMLRSRYGFAAAGLPRGGDIVCAGGYGGDSSAEMWGPPAQGAADAAWTWRQLPAMSVERPGCRGCVMSDGRFAVLAAGAVEVLSRRHARRWRSATMMSTGRLCCPCTSHGTALHARLLRDASSSPEGRVVVQLKSTMRCAVGGCGFRATYLTTCVRWAARFCRRSENA